MTTSSIAATTVFGLDLDLFLFICLAVAAVLAIAVVGLKFTKASARGSKNPP
ncbi:MAG: hypothetical protein M3433_03505 [Actinomycetota bacterium]|nr:hypothetical protein [Actinomycetota bacterium]